MNLTDFCIMTEKEYALVSRCQGCMSSYSCPSALLRLPVWKGIFRNDTSQPPFKLV